MKFSQLNPILWAFILSGFSASGQSTDYVKTGLSTTADCDNVWTETANQQSSILALYRPANTPVSSIAGIVANFRYDLNYGFQIGSFYGDVNNIYLRSRNSSIYSNWWKIWHSGNFNPAAETLDVITQRGATTNSQIVLTGGNNIYFRNADPGDLIFQNQSQTEFGRVYSRSNTLFLSAGTTPNENVYIYNDLSGNISRALLYVNGEVRSRKVKVTQTGWPDYVFHESYPLPTLAALEQYINIHKHLPEMPDAKAIAEDGLDVGEMNRKLLQKVEELTLYIIQQDKEMQAVKERLNTLEATSTQ